MREAVKLHMVCLSSYNDRHPVPMIDFRLQKYHTNKLRPNKRVSCCC